MDTTKIPEALISSSSGTISTYLSEAKDKSREPQFVNVPVVRGSSYFIATFRTFQVLLNCEVYQINLSALPRFCELFVYSATGI